MYRCSDFEKLKEKKDENVDDHLRETGKEEWKRSRVKEIENKKNYIKNKIYMGHQSEKNITYFLKKKNYEFSWIMSLVSTCPMYLFIPLEL